jgi:putative colanic acid biosynthesis acetyltransferase WcaF
MQEPTADRDPAIATVIRLDRFDARKGLDRGRSYLTEACWYLLKCAFFLSPLPWPMSWKRFLLRLFGARIGAGVVIKPRVSILFPWKLSIGDHAWIGEEVLILNFESVEIGAHACLSQRAFLCAGNHDSRDPLFSYRNAPIRVGAGAWIGAQSFVGPGVVVGPEAMACAGSVVVKDLPAGWVCRGNPCRPVKERGLRENAP